MRKPALWPLALAILTVFLASCASYNQNTQTGSPFVYVGSSPNAWKADPSIPAATYGFSVAPDGQLKPIPGFPLSFAIGGEGYVENLVSGHYVFAYSPDALHIDTYRIGADGALSKVQSTAIPGMNGCLGGGCLSGGPALVDRSGTTLFAFFNSSSAQLYYQIFDIDQGTGALTYQSVMGPASGPGGGFRLAIADNLHAYGWAGYDGPFGGTCTNYIAVFARGADGSFSSSADPAVAAGPALPSGYFYGDQPLASDETNHLAGLITACDSKGNISGQQMLVSFTINADGTMTSGNTKANMPAFAAGLGFTGSLSPSGKLLAVAGSAGLQVFNFNGAAPMTAATGPIAVDPIQQVAWDKHNHLYALSTSKLYVFTAAGSGLVQAAGSPYSLPNATSMFVQPG